MYHCQAFSSTQQCRYGIIVKHSTLHRKVGMLMNAPYIKVALSSELSHSIPVAHLHIASPVLIQFAISNQTIHSVLLLLLDIQISHTIALSHFQLKQTHLLAPLSTKHLLYIYTLLFDWLVPYCMQPTFKKEFIMCICCQIRWISRNS